MIDSKDGWDRLTEKHGEPFLSVHRGSDKTQLDPIAEDVIKKVLLQKGEACGKCS